MIVLEKSQKNHYRFLSMIRCGLREGTRQQSVLLYLWNVPITSNNLLTYFGINWFNNMLFFDYFFFSKIKKCLVSFFNWKRPNFHFNTLELVSLCYQIRLVNIYFWVYYHYRFYKFWKMFCVLFRIDNVLFL